MEPIFSDTFLKSIFSVFQVLKDPLTNLMDYYQLERLLTKSEDHTSCKKNILYVLSILKSDDGQVSFEDFLKAVKIALQLKKAACPNIDENCNYMANLSVAVDRMALDTDSFPQCGVRQKLDSISRRLVPNRSKEVTNQPPSEYSSQGSSGSCRLSHPDSYAEDDAFVSPFSAGTLSTKSLNGESIKQSNGDSLERSHVKTEQTHSEQICEDQRMGSYTSNCAAFRPTGDSHIVGTLRSQSSFRGDNQSVPGFADSGSFCATLKSGSELGSLLHRGLAAVRLAEEWYLRKLSAFGAAANTAASTNALLGDEERVRINEINRHLLSLMEMFPASESCHGDDAYERRLAQLARHVGCRVDVSLLTQVDALKRQNAQLSTESASLSHAIGRLEREKNTLIRQLFQVQSARIGSQRGKGTTTFL